MRTEAQVALQSSLPALRQEIASLLQQHLGVDRDRALSGLAFTQLHPGFDSLDLLELQLLLEKQLGFELEPPAGNSPWPSSLEELAQEVLRQSQARGGKQDESLQLATANAEGSPR